MDLLFHISKNNLKRVNILINEVDVNVVVGEPYNCSALFLCCSMNPINVDIFNVIAERTNKVETNVVVELLKQREYLLINKLFTYTLEDKDKLNCWFTYNCTKILKELYINNSLTLDNVKFITDFIQSVNVIYIDILTQLISYDNSYEIIKYLIEERGLLLNKFTGRGITPLQECCHKVYTNVSRPNLVKLLIENGAYINTKDKNGHTALMYACSGGSFEIVKLLIEAGADKNIKNNRGKTALDIATKYEEWDGLEDVMLDEEDRKKIVCFFTINSYQSP